MAKKGGAPTKSEILATICKDTGLSRKQVSSVFDSLSGVIRKSLRGNGLFTLPPRRVRASTPSPARR